MIGVNRFLTFFGASLVVCYSIFLRCSILPPLYFFWISFLILSVPCIYNLLNENSWRSSILIVIAVSFIVNSMYGLMSSNNLLYFRDPIYEHQLMTLVSQSEFWSPGMGVSISTQYSFYPSMTVLNVIFSLFSGLRLDYSLMWFTGVLRSILIPLSVFIFIRTLTQNNKIATISCLIYLTCPRLTIKPHREGLA